MFPEGYELAFIIWSDYLMADKKWNLSYNKWKGGVDDWLIDLEKVANSLGLKKYKSLLRVSLTERVLGTILTDITASDRTDVKKKNGRNFIDNLLIFNFCSAQYRQYNHIISLLKIVSH